MNGALINNEIFISIKGLQTLLGRLYGSSKRIFMSETLLQLSIIRIPQPKEAANQVTFWCTHLN